MHLTMVVITQWARFLDSVAPDPEKKAPLPFKLHIVACHLPFVKNIGSYHFFTGSGGEGSSVCVGSRIFWSGQNVFTKFLMTQKKRLLCHLSYILSHATYHLSRILGAIIFLPGAVGRGLLFVWGPEFFGVAKMFLQNFSCAFLWPESFYTCKGEQKNIVNRPSQTEGPLSPLSSRSSFSLSKGPSQKFNVASKRKFMIIF